MPRRRHLKGDRPGQPVFGEHYECDKGSVETTKLIAVNVDGTTSSVTYVTGQIQMVAEGARGARAMARNVEEVCSEASASVRELQRNLVRIVRTSSGTVNRRAHQRYEVNSFGTMDKRIAPIEIVDLSESGPS